MKHRRHYITDRMRGASSVEVLSGCASSPADAEGHLRAQSGVGHAVEVLKPLHADLAVAVALAAGRQHRLQSGAAVSVVQARGAGLVARGAEHVVVGRRVRDRHVVACGVQYNLYNYGTIST